MNQQQKFTPATDWKAMPHPLYPGLFCVSRKVGDRREHMPSETTPSAMAMFYSRDEAAQAIAKAAA